MVKIIEKPIGIKDLKSLAEEIGGFYIKVVIDIERGILAAGAKMHIDEERMLLDQGSSQSNLWGGGFDLEMKQVTFDSIINNRPGVNASSDILDPVIRKKFEDILKRLLNL